MNKIKSVIIGVALLAVATVQAQTTNAITPSVNGLAETFASWVSTYDTNLSFQDVIVWDGPVYENQVNIANEIGGSYDIWRSTNSIYNGTLFAGVEGRFRQAGIAGALVSEGAGGEFGWMKYDFRAGIFLDGVYLNNPVALGASSRLAVEGGVFADKMLSPSSAVGIFISEQSGQKYPIIGANLNVSFGNGKGFLGLF